MLDVRSHGPPSPVIARMIFTFPIAVVPVLVGPLSALLALFPAILAALGGIVIALFKPASFKRILRFLWAQKIMVVTMVLLVWGGGRLFSVVFPSTGQAATLEEAGAWAMWRGGMGRTAAVKGAAEPSQGNVVWSYVERDVKTFHASPAVVGNRIYITSARYEYFKDTGAICAVDADTGEEAWSYRADGYLASFSSPAVSGKYLVVGEGLHLTRNARVICMDVEESEKRGKGVKLWAYRTDSHVESSPCIYEDRVFVGAGDDGFYCFALEPDEKGNARVLWHLKGEDYPDCETSPVAHDGRVYFGLGNNGQAVCCVDAMTGELVWRVETPYPVFGSPTLSGDRLFLGMGYGDFVNTAEQVAANLRAKLNKDGKSESEIEEAVSAIRPIGEVWCLDTTTGEKLWSFTCERTVLGAVAVDGDRLYANSRDQHVYCLSLDGRLIKKWGAGEPITTSPCVGRDHLYIVTASAHLYGLDRRTLSPVWEVSLDSETLSSPALARGHIYVGSANQGLLCVGQPASEPATPRWAGHLGGNGKSGWWDGSLIPERGSYARWGFPDEMSEGLLPVQTPVACLGKSFYLGVNRPGGSGLVRLTRGESIHQKPEEDWFFPSTHPVSISPAATADRVFFVDGVKGDSGRHLVCLDLESAEERWRHPVEQEADGGFVITGKRLFVNDTARDLTCLDIPSGSMRWRTETGAGIGAPCIESVLVLTASGIPPRVVALDVDTGVPIWERVLDAPPTTGPISAAGRVWVGASSGLVGFSLIPEQQGVRIDGAAVTGTLVSDGARVACITDAGELLVVDAGTGATLASVPGVAGNFPPLLTDHACLFNADGAIKIYDFHTGSIDQWVRLTASWPGTMVTPMVMVNSHVFFATDKKGLLCMKPKRR